MIYLKQAQTPAVSRHITDERVRGYFQHEGHRTVISQRALQAHADPWLGWTELDGAGQLVAEVSPYAVDLDWSDLDDPAEIAAVVADLGRATATMHGAADDESGHSLVPFNTERAIDAAIAADEEGFPELLVEFAHSYGRGPARTTRSSWTSSATDSSPAADPAPPRSDRPDPTGATATLGTPYRFSWHTRRRWTYRRHGSGRCGRHCSRHWP